MDPYVSGQLAHDRQAHLQAEAADSRLAATARGARRQEPNAARPVLAVETVGGIRRVAFVHCADTITGAMIDVGAAAEGGDALVESGVMEAVGR